MPTEAEIYGYGTIANVVCCLCSLGGAVVLPCAKRYSTVYHVVLSVFMGLAVGTLASDALLHLIPEAFGLHGHDTPHTAMVNPNMTKREPHVDTHELDHHHHPHGDEHAHEEENHADEHHHGDEEFHVEAYVWYCLIIMLGIYVFYILEMIMTYVQGRSGISDDHDHDPVNLTAVNGLPPENFSKMSESDFQNEKTPSDLTVKKKITFTPLVIMIIVGDAIHNFADGLAIAAAFSISLIDGLSITIAIFCHELPHELGDFAILMSSGMGFCKALLANLFSSLTALIGFYVGVPISTQDSAKQWIFAITAGMFLYISLVDMLPTLVKQGKGRWKTICYHNIGILIGALIIILLAVFEEHIDLH